MELILNKKYETRLKVYVGMCVHRDLKVRVFRLFKELEKCPDVKFTTHIVEGDALIARSRSRMASEFMKTDNDILFFLDDDITYNVNDLRKLCIAMKQEDLDIAGAPYMLKREHDPNFAVKFLGDGEYPFGKSGGLIEVENVSTGFMAIKRRVFQKMIDEQIVHNCFNSGTEFYPFFKDEEKEIKGRWEYLSEDWAFCERARALGFKVWLDTSIKLGHIGQKTFTWDDFFKVTMEHNDEFIHKVVTAPVATVDEVATPATKESK